MSLAVNGKQMMRASLQAQGWLSAHVNMTDGVEAEEPDRVWVVAFDKTEEPNSITSEWDSVPLHIGDKVLIELLPDGESDAPASIRRSLDRPNNLFSDLEQARSLLTAVKICDTQLMGVMDRAQGVEPKEELEKLQSAIGSILVELDRQLISPTIRRHPELLAEAQEKGLY